MSPTNEPLSPHLIALHDQATAMLSRKLANIPGRVWPSGRKPSMRDIYESAEACSPPHINPKCNLIFLLSHHNLSAAANFRARKTQQDGRVAIAIYNFQTDPHHSFSCAHPEIRWNVLLANIVLASPALRDAMDGAKVNFLTLFLDAWREEASRKEHGVGLKRDEFVFRWRRTGFDLVRWTSSSRRDRMRDAVRALQKHVPPTPFSADEFLCKAQEQPRSEYAKHGRAWAMQYVVYKEREMAARDRAAQEREAVNEFHAHVLEDMMGDLGVQDKPPEYLTDDLFESEAVLAVLERIDEDVVRLPPEVANLWFDPGDAIALVEGTYGGVEEVTEGIAEMGMLHT